jgi:solute carrier family 24 (sodium/potassium/calcium exchanger), member 6
MDGLLAVAEETKQKAKMSYVVNKSKRETEISSGYVDDIIRKSELTNKDNENLMTEDEVVIEQMHRDRLFIANKMRHLFRQTQEEGILNSLMKLISVPMTLLRDYTTPMGEEDAWDRNRAATIPVTIVFAFLWLNGNMQEDESDKSEFQNMYFLIGLMCMLPGALIGVIIKLKTKVSTPPPALMTLYAFLCFLMSIMWIQFTSNVIMDLLTLFGFITELPAALLALTIIAWGNCLGDMTADVAMTRRGFGEMAITGTVAGPIFNILMGLGLAMSISIIKNG